MGKVVIAGGSGAPGARLSSALGDKCEVVVLTRQPASNSGVRQVFWDGQTVGQWAAELDEPDTSVINLAGKLVDCRPNATNIDELINSRVAPTRALVRASQQLRAPLAHWVQASTTAIWSDAGEIRCTESTPIPADGLPQMTGVARPWEAAFVGANVDHGVILRISIVLDAYSAALKRLAALTRWGLGGTVGSGRQWVSWIHLHDWLAIVQACLGLNPALNVPAGVLVAAAPNPARNADFMAALRRTLHRPGLPTPSAVLRLGAGLMRSDPALALTGRHVTSQILDDLGFRFEYPTLEGALSDLLQRSHPRA
ncbi:MAG: DUF1731 domain-containing protein [Actinomycetia bacterium]|nr:DUF1731 domain-containing protein [Actinomycetes bacterium]